MARRQQRVGSKMEKSEKKEKNNNNKKRWRSQRIEDTSLSTMGGEDGGGMGWRGLWFGKSKKGLRV